MSERVVLGVPLVHVPVTGSTMDEVIARAAEGAPEGLAVVTDRQTAGRGRAGRTWTHHTGESLLVSVLLRPTLPPEQLGTLPLLVGIAAAEAIEGATGREVALKWPNDLLLDGAKVGGILLTSVATGDRVQMVVVGLGINLSGSGDELPAGATSLELASGRRVSRDDLLASFLARLSEHYTAWQGAGGAGDLHGWRRRMAFAGEQVRVEDGARTWEGTLAGIDDSGRLLLRDATGAEHAISAGDVVRGPQPAR